MRTSDQLNNLRRAFSLAYGPVFLFCPDEDVNFLADRIQDGLDKNSLYTWEIRTVTEDNFETDWATIKPEPKNPYCSIYIIKRSCESLLKRHREIISILATAKEDSKVLLRFGPTS